MKFEERWYQVECSKAITDSLLESEDNKPIVAIPTGAGKTVILAQVIQTWLEANPHDEILVLSHTKKIIEQDIAALEEYLPDTPIGAYSAGLIRKEHEQVTVGGIQSVIKNPDLFKWSNLVIIDEVHKVSHRNEGSYRKLLNSMQSRLVGLSATIFRTGHGYIHEGKGTLFNKLAYDLTSVKNYNRLVKEGYLSKLIAVEPKIKLDSSKVTKSAGDYNVKSLAQAHDKMSITKAALTEALHYGKKYHKWLVFAIDIDHAEHINTELNNLGIDSSVLHSRMRTDEEVLLRGFTEGKKRALVSVEKLTTGFDAPNVDLILMLRPTMSAILHVQMSGRGTRPFKGKDHCLFLDYAGNTARLGPINNVIIPKASRGDSTGEAPTKTCPKCSTITYTLAKVCESCGHEFVFESKLTMSASSEAIVEEGLHPPSKERWMIVDRIQYNIHRKPNSPDILLATYHCGLQRVKEYWCLNHPGFAGRKAAHMAGYRGYKGDLTTYDVYRNRASLRVPTKILVDSSGKYQQIKNSIF